MRVLAGLLSLLLITSAFAKNVKLKDPPDELSKYYPPKSEKMEFLHLMHELSTSLTGLVVNLKGEDWQNAQLWAKKLQENYLKIGQMVKKWDRNLKKANAQKLLEAVKNKDKATAMENLKAIGRTCVQCHRTYQASVKVKYHTPDFSKINVEDPVSGQKLEYGDYMKNVANDMKLLKVYLTEGKNKEAKKAGLSFTKRLKGLSQSCSECHTQEEGSEKIYFGERTQKHINALQEAIKKSDKKAISTHIGWIAQNNCVKCHNVHQTLYLLKEKFGN